MKDQLYKKVWLAFVQIRAADGFKFNDLISNDEIMSIAPSKEYIGAWANILVKADDIFQALDIIPLGLGELNFEVEFIDKIENVYSLIESNEINEDVKYEVEWLLESNYVFKVSDKIFPYCPE